MKDMSPRRNKSRAKKPAKLNSAKRTQDMWCACHHRVEFLYSALLRYLKGKARATVDGKPHRRPVNGEDAVFLRPRLRTRSLKVTQHLVKQTMLKNDQNIASSRR